MLFPPLRNRNLIDDVGVQVVEASFPTERDSIRSFPTSSPISVAATLKYSSFSIVEGELEGDVYSGGRSGREVESTSGVANFESG